MKFLKMMMPATAAICATGFFSGCTSERFAQDMPLGDFRVLARYEAETTHEETRVSGSAECSSWLYYFSDTSNTSGGYYSDIGSLFSGLSQTQSLALRSAIADACKKSGADLLLMPRYEMKTTSVCFIYEAAECSVTGYPAKVQKIRQVPITFTETSSESVPVQPISL